MKLIQKTGTGYKLYSHIICGYECRVFETPEKYISIGVPMGDTTEEKKMFDSLVYHNKSVYNGKGSRLEVVRKVKNFIIKWQKEHFQPIVI